MNKFFVKNPIISEKAVQLSSLGKYIFLVDKTATKPEVKKVVEGVYKVNITNVHIVNIKPKKRRLGRSIGVKSGYKKAVVTLKAGQKLDVLPHN